MSDPQRPLLPPAQVHPALPARMARYQSDILDEVRSAISQQAVVVVGMKQNPFPRKARKLLEQAGIAYTYLGYGSYFSQWRRRLALKMWAGWPTFPMIFVHGVLIGGATELERLMESGELAALLAKGR
ncbi:glutaredoxin domain-containing protein [Massilia sp. SM-13]|uniref:glutaredoxin domain-containing protein n=1 Tax=Pseudoduganella rhizocola TaxID=3382643 RepID=UPI0038B5EF17